MNKKTSKLLGSTLLLSSILFSSSDAMDGRIDQNNNHDQNIPNKIRLRYEEYPFNNIGRIKLPKTVQLRNQCVPFLINKETIAFILKNYFEMFKSYGLDGNFGDLYSTCKTLKDQETVMQNGLKKLTEFLENYQNDQKIKENVRRENSITAIKQDLQSFSTMLPDLFKKAYENRGKHPFYKQAPDGVNAKMANLEDMENLIRAIPRSPERARYKQIHHDFFIGKKVSGQFATSLIWRTPRNVIINSRSNTLVNDIKFLSEKYDKYECITWEICPNYYSEDPYKIDEFFNNLAKFSHQPTQLYFLPNDQELIDLARNLKTNTTITSLKLRFFTKNNNTAIQELADGIEANDSITYLSSSESTLCDQGIALGKAMARNYSIISLYLRNSEISDKGLEALSDSLKINTSLASLNLSHNKIGNQGLQAFGKALEINNTLTSVDLSSNDKVNDEGLEWFAQSLQMNSSLNLLDLKFIKIGDKGLQAFGGMLQKNNKLNLLSISLGDKSSEKGIKAFANSLKLNNSLTSLIISFKNSLDEKQMQAFAEGLENNKSLTSLDLSFSCEISKRIMQELAQGLKNNKSLTSLHLRCMEKIEVGGLSALAEILYNNKKLTSLSFSSPNCILTKDVLAFAAAIQKNQTLNKLSLDYDSITELGKKALDKVLKTKSIKTLGLSNWFCDEEGKRLY